MATTASFGPELLTFLRQLRRNNNREWFQRNKTRYETAVRDPLLRFVEGFAPRLHAISPHFVADARPVGGSLFRIYRDTRFSKDKTPYKTAAAVQFRHERGKDVHAPGYYLHVEPGSIFGGVGIWHPEAGALMMIRDAIAERPGEWKRAVSGRAFTREFAMGGDSLKRPPKGYDPDHPFVEDLKRKDFVAFREFTEEDFLGEGFSRVYAASLRRATPFMSFLTRAVGLPW